MNLSLENGAQWRVQWDDTLVLPQLKGSNYLSMERQGICPARANIYDRNGHALVAQADATAFGPVPGQIDPAQADGCLHSPFRADRHDRGEDPGAVCRVPGRAGWYLPLGEVPAELIAATF